MSHYMKDQRESYLDCEQSVYRYKFPNRELYVGDDKSVDQLPYQLRNDGLPPQMNRDESKMLCSPTRGL